MRVQGFGMFHKRLTQAGVLGKLQSRHRGTGPVVVTAVALLCGTCIAGTEPKPDHLDALATIVPSMEKAQSEIQLPAQIIREYHIGTPAKISTDSQVIAEMDYTPSPRYVIQKRDGSLRAEF